MCMKNLTQILREGKKVKQSVGIVIIAKDTNNFLLLHRANKPIAWSLLSGKMDKKGETPLNTLKREIEEEIGANPDDIEDIAHIGSIKAKGKIFHIHVGYVEHEFEMPNLAIEENDDYGWFNLNNLPSPMHYRWSKTLQLVKPLLSLRESMKINLKQLIGW